MSSKRDGSPTRAGEDLAAAATSRAHGPHYVLRSLRYWDVKMPPVKKHMLGGRLVPTVKSAMSRILTKKRRITIEVYQPASLGVEATKVNKEKQKKICAELLKGISSNELFDGEAIGDNDVVECRVLKPQRTSDDDEENHMDDGDWGKMMIWSSQMYASFPS
jgi:hypothetical protein